MTADELNVALDAMYELRKAIKHGATPWRDYPGVKSLSDGNEYLRAMHRVKVSLEDMLTNAVR